MVHVTSRLFICMVLALSWLPACSREKGYETMADDPDLLVNNGVTIIPFNYTEYAINDITVDGVWAGGVDVFSGGGGAAGLLKPRDRSRQHSVKVEWDVGSHYDLASNRYQSEKPLQVHHRAMVPIKFPYPDEFEVLALHFYPDGHVEADFTGMFPEPRVAPPSGFDLGAGSRE